MTYQDTVDRADADGEAPEVADGRRPALRGSLDLLRRRRVLIYGLVVVALFGQMAIGMITSARQQSPTTDEPVYVGAAIVYTQQHTLAYNFEHPPLAKLVMATGLAFDKAKVNPRFITTSHEWNLGNDVLYGKETTRSGCCSSPDSR